MTSTYSTGTISVGNGSTTVTGVGTSWLSAGIRAGDDLRANGLTGVIAAVNSNTSITLANGWAGTTISGGNYNIRLIDDAQRSLAVFNQLLQSLGSGNLTSIAALSTAANKLTYWTGAGIAALTDLTAFGRSLIDDANAAAARTTMGLGDAAMATVVTSNADNTSGRVLTTGYMGIGATGPGIPEITDFSLAHLNGFHRFDASTVAGFVAGVTGQHVAIVHRGANNRTNIIVMDGSNATTHRMWFGSRATATGAISNWTEIYHAGTILGTVSQSGGLPTGKVIERGSNANGEFVRFADGTQICWHTITASSGGATSWTFPAAFSAAPRVIGNATATVLSAVMQDSAPTTTAASFSARDKTDARRADPVRIMAIGRWF